MNGTLSSIALLILTSTSSMQRRRREIEFDTRMVTLECGVGSYVIDNLAHSSEYFIAGRIFFKLLSFQLVTLQIQFDPVHPTFFRKLNSWISRMWKLNGILFPECPIILAETGILTLNRFYTSQKTNTLLH